MRSSTSTANPNRLKRAPGHDQRRDEASALREHVASLRARLAAEGANERELARALDAYIGERRAGA
jgi:hypothetical protein